MAGWGSGLAPIPRKGIMAKPADRPRTVVIHSLAHARAALAAAAKAGAGVRLRSAPNAAAYAGAAWFQEVVQQAGDAYPGVAVEASLDCGDHAGLALGALRQGIRLVRFTGPRAVRERIAAIASGCGGALDRDRRRALDLGRVAERDAETALEDWLARR